MIDPATVATESIVVPLVSGLAFGFLNSLHCAGMCGPLIACSNGGLALGAGYHGARVAAYSVVGVLAGSVGGAVGADSLRPGGALFALVLATIMVIAAFGFGSRLGAVPGSRGLMGRAVAFVRGLPSGIRGVTLGFVTPLLPCGLLYAAVALAVAAGSAAHGLAVMAGFGMGMVPALALAQWKFGAIRERIGARASVRLVQGVMLLSAGLLLWRGIAALVVGPEACCGCEGAR